MISACGAEALWFKEGGDDMKNIYLYIIACLYFV